MRSNRRFNAGKFIPAFSLWGEGDTLTKRVLKRTPTLLEFTLWKMDYISNNTRN